MPLLVDPPAAPRVRAVPQPKEKPAPPAVADSRPVSYSVESTLAEIPGHLTALGAATTGEELGELFAKNPELPGVILLDQDRFSGIISQAHFYKCVSRAFGREIYYRRPASIMLGDVTEKPLILESGCEIPEAVERCLARPRDYVYEPFLVYHQPDEQYRLCSFQVLLLAATQIAALRARQMEQILDSVTDGLLVIDRKFEVGGEYSRAVEKILERDDIANQSLLKVIEPLVDPTTVEQLKDYLGVLFDPKLIDRLIKSINPAKQLTAQFSSRDGAAERTKHFGLNFERIRTGKEISQVLVRIEDITQRVELAKELERQEASSEERLHLVMQILQVEPASLHRFMEHFHEAVNALDRATKGEEIQPEARDTVHALFRQIHSLKGEAGVLRLAGHERHLHQLEDKLEPLRSMPFVTMADLISFRPAVEGLRLLALQMHEALEQLKSLHARPGAPVESSTSNGHNAAAASGGLNHMLSGLVSDLNERLGKSVSLHSSVREDEWPRQHEEVLREMLIHLIRNSMVHGIEPAHERVEMGKNPQGLLQLELKSAHPDFYELIFQDDGRGLPYDKIRERAKEMGLSLESNDELSQAIFAPGFSTADNVTDLAGRGVGLDAIRHALDKAGGKIIPHSEPGAYCAFQVLLPKTGGHS